jgi:mycofactocin system FadH/OYE family oxidoreductase 2
MNDYKYLFSPLKIGSITAKNRVVFSAHMTNNGQRGVVTDKHIAYYTERAKGGAGLIITEEQSVHPTDRAYEKLIDAFDRRVIAGYRILTESVHAYGTKIFAQINHNGSQGNSNYSRMSVWGASAIPDPIFREIPKQMEIDDIRQVVEGYAIVARHVKEGGFDGAELQASHSSLIRQFLSPVTNRRKDEYGGSLENRMRYVLELIAGIRETVGRDFVLGIRLCGDELIPGGITLEQTLEIAKKLEATGMIDYINTSIGNFHNLFMVEGSMHVPLGYATYMASAIRKVVNIPVFTAGRINDPVQAEQVLAEGHADMVGVVRGQICDPEFTIKAQQGRLNDIRKCIACNQYCVGRMGLNRFLSCIQNPGTGNEKLYGIGTLKPAATRKKVWVIGGGPAGLEAAKIAAQRGHYVTIFEKSDALGGMITQFSKIPNRGEFYDHVRNQLNQLDKLSVEVRLGVDVTADMVMQSQPDAVVVAVGAKKGNPPFMVTADAVPTGDSRDVLRNGMQLGKKVVLVDFSGGQPATSVAELLIDLGHEVEFLTAALYPAADLGPTQDLPLWYDRVQSKGIKITTNVVVKEVSQVIRVFNHYSGQEWDIPADSVVYASAGVPNDDLYFQLKGKTKELYRAGDCLAPRRVEHAVLDGHRIGRTI